MSTPLLPTYKSHKTVRAAKITAFRQNGNPDMPDLVLGDIDCIVSLLPDWHQKHQPKVGGYLVQYEDGYQSYSPSKAFEEGYTEVIQETATDGGRNMRYEGKFEGETDAEQAKRLNAANANPLEDIARVCHEVNRAYCQALGDNSQPTWEDAPEWQRSSARMGVDLHSMGNFGPEASHISWMQQKLDEGWKYGPVKDADHKTHPCIRPFAELPPQQQAKDFIFRAIVHQLRTTHHPV